MKFDLNVKSLSYNVLQRTEFNIVSTIENSLHNIILTVMVTGLELIQTTVIPLNFSYTKVHVHLLQ